MEEITFIQNCFESYDETFTWYIPDNSEKETLKNELIKETDNNPHLHIKKYKLKDIIPLAKHKERDDVLFLLPGGQCTIAHLIYDNPSREDDMHFVFFSTCQSALKYILKQYRTEYLGEKEFVLSPRDKFEIALFLIQFIVFLMVPDSIRGMSVIIFGIILYAMILFDWKDSGFNLIRDRKLEHSKVIPLLKYQIVYIFTISIMLLIGIPLILISGWMAG